MLRAQGSWDGRLPPRDAWRRVLGEAPSPDSLDLAESLRVYRERFGTWPDGFMKRCEPKTPSRQTRSWVISPGS